MDIWINLHVISENELSRPIHRNDMHDIAFLAVAVPYCDVVVVEKYWAHILQTSGLDKKYGCLVINSVSDLPELLGKVNSS